MLRQTLRFLLLMPTCLVVRSFLGGKLLGGAPTLVVLPRLAAILPVSAVTVWRH